MMKRPRFISTARVLLAAACLLGASAATTIKPDLLAGLKWRNVGPFRAGRIAATSGAVGVVGTFYVGLPAGGVWKTTSAGETWYPVFDAVPGVSSIGAIEVAPSNPNVIYVGTGDMVTGGTINEGNGVYKSTDAGATWKHIGLDASKQIPSIAVDPRNANTVLVAAQGDLHAKSDARGVFRSEDGGATWKRTLYVADSIGIQKLAMAYDHPDVIFATTTRHYNAPPPPTGTAPAGLGGFGGGGTGPTGTAVYKSTDNGVTWKELTGGGIPRLSGRTSIVVANNSNAQRVYLIGTNGFWRSDDGGTTWKQMASDDSRIRSGQGGYNTGVYVDARNPDVVYTFNTASYKSVDGGKTFTGFKGAPGGDDPQQGWFDPTNSDRILLGYDQGAIVSLDGGKTWSSWYNQSTEQVYHISTDNGTPYWIYATQQDAGAIRTRNRGNLGAITPMDWNPVNGWEWGTIIPDPVNANTVWASGAGIVKISYPSEQWINVSPSLNPDLRLRATSSNPILFAPWNSRELLAGFQYVMSTTDGGLHWKKISLDLGYPKGVTPPSDTATPQPGTPQGGAIETISASTVMKGLIWVGTNNGLIKVTKDGGKTWDDVSIPNLPYSTRALIEMVDASHFDAGTAYAAVDLLRLGDYTPYLFRTRDFGKTWTRITDGMPTGEPGGSATRVIRNDPKRKGLLFAGTESGMHVSFDDGDHWQSLQLNLPVTSYRDIAFHGNDLIVGTYGRGIWILDDYAVLRQMQPEIADKPVHLFTPEPAVRIRRNVNADTPFPPEAPHALNPPDGVIVNYWLAVKPSSEVTIDVLDSAGAVVRHLSSVASAPAKEAARPPHPNFWVAAPYAISANAGLNRANWDLRYDAPPAFSHSFEINANPELTPTSPEGAVAAPGTYTVRLTVDGKRYEQKAVVTNDPRSPASLADVRAQVALARKLQDGMRITWDAYQQANALRTAVAATQDTKDAELAKAITTLRAKVDSVGGNAEGGRGFGGFGGRGGRTPPNFFSLNGRFASQLGTHDNGDHAPTEAMLQTYAASCRDLGTTITSWQAIVAKDVPALNALLEKNGRKPVTATAGVAPPKC
jgi:photosystem II stability/assembly factor-like uncharacterized protein